MSDPLMGTVFMGRVIRDEERGNALDSIFADAPADAPSAEFDPDDPDALEKLYRIVSSVKDELDLHRSRTEAIPAKRMVEEARDDLRANPAVWRLLLDQASAAAASGTRFSAKRIVEDVRAGKHKSVGENAVHKLNNSYTAVYARFVADAVPDVEACIEFRPSKADAYFGRRGGKRVGDSKRRHIDIEG